MYFIPRNNRVYHFVAHLKKPYRYMITLLVPLFFIGIWFFIMYQPLEHMIEKKERVIQEYQEKQFIWHKSVSAMKELDKKVISAKNKLNLHGGFHTEEQTIQELVVYLLNKAQRSGLTLLSYQYENECNKGWCTKKLIRCSFNGSMHNVQGFLEGIAQSKKQILCKTCSIDKISENNYTAQFDVHFVNVKKV